MVASGRVTAYAGALLRLCHMMNLSHILELRRYPFRLIDYGVYSVRSTTAAVESHRNRGDDGGRIEKEPRDRGL